MNANVLGGILVKIIKLMSKIVLTATVAMIAIETIRPKINRKTKRKIKRYMKVGKSITDNIYTNTMKLLE